MKIISVRTEDGLTLQGWYSPPRDGKPVIVLFHGNASHPGGSALKTRELREAGYGALLPAYRGYAGNPGKPSERGLYADARAFIGWLASEQKIAAQDIVLYGESLGTGVVVEMAAGSFSSVKAVILESPYTSFSELAARHYFFVPFAGKLVRDRYDNLSKISGLKAPLLVVHGRRDTIVPFDLGQALFDAANQPKTMIALDAAGHNDLYLHGAGQRILHYISGL